MARKKKERLEANNVQILCDSLNKKYGIGTALLGSDVRNLKIEFFSTGNAALDISLRGGLPYNRLVEIIGAESACKTSQVHLTSQAFLNDNPKGYVVHCDLENSLDFFWMKRLGCKLDNRYVFVYADSGEQAGDIVDDVIADRTLPVCLILDSIMGIVPLIELESTMDSQFMGKQPALINRIIRVMISRLKAAKVGGCARTSLILVNQTRPVIGGSPYQNPIDSSGGQGRKFFCSQRMVFTSGSSAEKEERGEGDHKHITRIGKKVSYSIIKNKCGGPEETGHFMFYNRPFKNIPIGVDNADAIINAGLLFNVLERKGNSIIYQRTVLGSSIDNAKVFLRKNEPMLHLLWGTLITAAQKEFMGDTDGLSTPKQIGKVTKAGGKHSISILRKKAGG